MTSADLLALADLREAASDYIDAASAIIGSLLESADLDDMDRIAVNKWSHAEQKLEAALDRARAATEPEEDCRERDDLDDLDDDDLEAWLGNR